MADRIHISRAPDVAHTAKNRVRLVLLDDNPARAFVSVIAMMIHPRVAQHLLAETTDPFPASPIVLRKRTRLLELESMRAGTQTDDGLARAQVRNKMFHLFVGQRPKPQPHHTQIRRIQGFHAGYVRYDRRRDRPVRRIDSEKRGALE